MTKAILIASLLLAAGARADEPYRLRADALVGSAPGVDAGILTLALDDHERPWLSADALVWVGSGGEGEADALVISVRLRDPKRRGELHLGRFVQIAGAVRPVHLDGAAARARLPWDLGLEVFGGVPVQPAFAAHAWDWVAGGRASRQLGDYGAAGVAFLERRTEGRLDDREVGLDAGVAPLPWLDAAGRVSWDLIDPGVSDAHASISGRRGPWRVELFGSHLSPSRLLPATSLFTVLGDTPSDKLGTSVRWRAAPRLDVTALGSTKPEARLGTTLRLDARGAGAIGLELRRDVAWSGVRGTLRVPLTPCLALSSELELVRPDDPGDRGSWWPWGLVALSWRPRAAWQLAAAFEGRASPEDAGRVDGLVRLTHLWGRP